MPNPVEEVTERVVSVAEKIGVTVRSAPDAGSVERG